MHVGLGLAAGLHRNAPVAHWVRVCVCVCIQARMESMYKCREDKEEWHRKLLDQYERAMADFDRRLHAATDDQGRRLTELRAQFATLRTQHRQGQGQGNQQQQPPPGIAAGVPSSSSSKGAFASS